MYGFVAIDSKEELNAYISDEQIFSYYFGDFYNNHWYASPFRPNEKNFSFRISYYNNKWVWTDFGESVYPNDVVEFVKRIYKLDYYSALQRIYDEIVKGTTGFIKVTSKPPTVAKKEVSIKIWKDYKSWEYDFWGRGGIPEYQLVSKYGIYIGEVWNNGLRIHTSVQDDPYYIYLFDRVKKSWKGYKPLTKRSELKFFSNNIASHIQGWELMLSYVGKSDVVFITKSYKDVVLLDQLGYPAVAPHTESMFLDPWDIGFLKAKFKYIYVFYDNDSTGINNCIKFTEEYGLYYINVPHGLNTIEKPTKDPWDVRVNYSRKLLDEIIIDKFIRDGV